jgi:hypothetical protein
MTISLSTWTLLHGVRPNRWKESGLTPVNFLQHLCAWKTHFLNYIYTIGRYYNEHIKQQCRAPCTIPNSFYYGITKSCSVIYNDRFLEIFEGTTSRPHTNYRQCFHYEYVSSNLSSIYHKISQASLYLSPSSLMTICS